MKKQRKKYPLEFKQDAVNHLIISGKTLRQAAENLGINPQNLSRWQKEFMAKATNNNSSKEDPVDRLRRLEEENKSLKKENTNLKVERDILKKAMGIVSKP